MKTKFVIPFAIICLTIFSLGTSGINSASSPIHQAKIDHNSDSLVIYTYDSLMADPYFDIAGNFSAYSGISNVTIERFSDANELVSKIVSEKDHPQADVVIGIDNALQRLTNLSDVLVPYDNTTILNELDQNLISNLDASHFLVPYDYGIISLYYKNHIVNASSYPVLNNFTFDNLAKSPLINQIITENPKISSTGLGFFLWTIGYYGDPDGNLNGLTGHDWKPFWTSVGKKMTITNSWGDAFTVFEDPKANKSVMVSYTTSPAYDSCIYNDNSTSAAVTTYDGKSNGWFQIEGLGLVKNAPNEDNGKQFMDWFLSTTIQSKIPTSQWMYPANKNAVIPICFTQASLNPDNITRLNNYAPPAALQYFLSSWLDEWEQMVVSTGIPGFEVTTLIVPFFLIGVLVIIRKKK